MIDKSKYDWIGDFYKRYAIIRSKNKYGIINEEGKKICEIKYAYIGYFEDGYAFVRLDEKYGWINRKGKEVVPPKYEYKEADKMFELYKKKLKLEELLK